VQPQFLLRIKQIPEKTKVVIENGKRWVLALVQPQSGSPAAFTR
jgi:hypothetical protein